MDMADWEMEFHTRPAVMVAGVVDGSGWVAVESSGVVEESSGWVVEESFDWVVEDSFDWVVEDSFGMAVGGSFGVVVGVVCSPGGLVVVVVGRMDADERAAAAGPHPTIHYRNSSALLDPCSPSDTGNAVHSLISFPMMKHSSVNVWPPSLERFPLDRIGTVLVRSERPFLGAHPDPHADTNEVADAGDEARENEHEGKKWFLVHVP